MFKWCFLSVSWYFSIVRHLDREPDFLTENRIFKNFSKSLKTCLVGVSECFMVLLALFNIWAENRIFSQESDFQKFPKCVKAWFVSFFHIVLHWSKNDNFYFNIYKVNQTRNCRSVIYQDTTRPNYKSSNHPFNLWLIDLVMVHDTSSPHGLYLCHMWIRSLK